MLKISSITCLTLPVCIGGSAGKTCYNNIDISCNQQINTFTSFSEIFYKYIDVCFQSNYFYSAVWSSIKQGSTPILNKGKWEVILVPICSTQEQAVIVSKVEALLGKCASLSSEVALLDNHSKTLMKALFKEVFEAKA